MKLRSLPPTGNPISLEINADPIDGYLPGYNLVWVTSGTAALGYCLEQIKRKHPEIEGPEVLIPGYCCPDLLSAAIYAGFKPVVVDICENDPSFNLIELEQKLNSNTLAVIAINFMGIKERLSEIRRVVAKYPLVSLIEDNAQWFPDEHETPDLEGDFVTFSFGRGKAISLLGGGLVATKRNVSLQGYSIAQPATGGLWRAKVKAYNLLLNPAFYYWMKKAPFITLGKTEYKPLEAISLLSPASLTYLGDNILSYRKRSADKENAYYFHNAVGEFNSLTDVINERSNRLLRFPFLCQSHEQKMCLIAELEKKGLGASPMYGSALDRVEGVASLLEIQSRLENSKSFAARFLTLPIHSGVSAAYMESLTRTVRSVVGK